MIIKVGDIVEHLGTQFVIVGIRRTEHIDGISLSMSAFDKEKADREQHKQIKMEETREGVIDMLGRFTKGEEPGSFGFGIGGLGGPGDEK